MSLLGRSFGTVFAAIIGLIGVSLTALGASLAWAVAPVAGVFALPGLFFLLVAVQMVRGESGSGGRSSSGLSRNASRGGIARGSDDFDGGGPGE